MNKIKNCRYIFPQIPESQEMHRFGVKKIILSARDFSVEYRRAASQSGSLWDSHFPRLLSRKRKRNWVRQQKKIARKLISGFLLGSCFFQYMQYVMYIVRKRASENFTYFSYFSLIRVCNPSLGRTFTAKKVVTKKDNKSMKGYFFLTNSVKCFEIKT